jgi:hypothetical protein
MARRNIQIHGGVGFIKEYGAEKLLRDAIVLPIYEGTSQIQSLMAMKDTLLGIMKRPQDFARRIGQARWRSLSGRNELDHEHGPPPPGRPRRRAPEQGRRVNPQGHRFQRRCSQSHWDG